MPSKTNRIYSELRQDLVSGDWILIAAKRRKRPHAFTKKKSRKKAAISGCPFEDPLKTHKSVLVYPVRNKPPQAVAAVPSAGRISNGVYEGKKGWELVIVENKYPAVFHKNACSRSFRHGPYTAVEGIGHHELVITRDHHRNLAHLSSEQANQVFQAFRDRYLMLLNDPCLAYVLIFHNWGPAAGASVYHPHYQLIAVPVVPPDVEHSLSGSRKYFKKTKRCVHCGMIAYERKEKTRIIYENKKAVVFAPFVSREPFELRVFPKEHLPYFENTPDSDFEDVVEALQFALKKIEKKMGDPDYNFFIHTAPVKDKQSYRHYHWHIEIIPQTNISAGFELGTGIEINPVDPDEAAKILKN